ncbi:MAG: hypothetical protein GEV05_30535 [Betaproteobacteria bacterium]|nr:hypothetical protein [Betaproteobacteria bacterium]
MKKTTWRLSLIAAAAAVVVMVLALPFARAQRQVSPSDVPIGVAASGGTSTAWFYRPSSGTVVACQSTASGAGALSGIQCVASKLP